MGLTDHTLGYSNFSLGVESERPYGFDRMKRRRVGAVQMCRIGFKEPLNLVLVTEQALSHRARLQQCSLSGNLYRPDGDDLPLNTQAR